ncbi:UDP-glucose:glycoprotein glucosyltransferase-domain-containing protein [Zychaea mexicana]|uniref:UDP-glucose:glycoprotein glucosyltransferase-domain-containing protein n=1 Tax=Zychaea mexicana TaxID=64656 RepID=UPI0022FDB8E8|nr:UDP-glucose:glycoprotein glucosyltransferase-domain-containing protein [Zychaea mexicana]KAI9482602.1 UDP-glucose:glycoprotein glucosyltransferase-domain-containing protein [Zychaea mexicana]
MRLKAIVLATTLTACLQHYALAAPSTTVDLTLVTPWCAPNLAVELVETASNGNNTLFFDFVDKITAKATAADSKSSDENTAQQIYNDALAIIEPYLTRPDLAKMALAIHAAAPRIEAYHQYYRENVHVSDVPLPCQQKGVWADIGGSQEQQAIVCSPDNLKFDNTHYYKPDLLPFDHVLLQQGVPMDHAVVLYTVDFSSDTFKLFHQALTRAVQERPGFAYIVRYMPPPNAADSKKCDYQLALTGYGVEMALKKTDYLVIDDRNNDASSTQASVKGKLASFGKKISQTLFEDDNATPSKVEPLTQQEIQDLGLKATQFITKSENPLSTLVQLAQDFPMHGRRISELSLDENLVREVLENRRSFSVDNAMWLNGVVLDENEVDPFSLIRALQREEKLIQSFESLGVGSHKAIDIMTHSSLSKMEANSQGGEPTDIYDVRSDLVLWWNNLEKDKRYKNWSSNLMDMLKPVYPGQLRAIKRNVYNVVMVENLATVDSLKRIAEQVVEMVKHNTPIRFGVVPMVTDQKDSATAVAVVLDNLYQTKGKKEGLAFLTKLLGILETSKSDRATLSMVEKAYGSSLAPLLEEKKDYIQQVEAFLARLGIGSTEPVMFLNGKLFELDEQKQWTRVLMMGLQEQTQLVARGIYFGSIDDDDNVYDYLLSQSYVSVSRNPYITVSEGHPLRMMALSAAHDTSDIIYLTAPESSEPDTTQVDTNVWIVADLDTLPGLKLASEALLFLEKRENVRLALIHNGDSDQSSKDATISTVLYRELASGNKDAIKELIDKAISSRDQIISSNPEQIKMFAPGSPIVESAANHAAQNQARVLGGSELEKNFSGIVVNGRIVGPLASEDTFTKDDFISLLRYETENRIQPVKEAFLASETTTSQPLPDVLTRIALLLEEDKASVQQDIFTAGKPTIRQRPYRVRKGEHSKISIGDETTAFAQIGVVLNPLSETAQKWAALLETLSEVDGIYIELHFSPTYKLTEIPMKRFYRYVFDRELHFDSTTGDLATPMAYFADLPVDALYTLGVDTINAWHVTVKDANVDLDNIQLSDAPQVSAIYELERILIEGHCVDAANRSPPRGLQFVLGTPSTAAMTDTIVMANLGYFQLKAQPGVWDLRLREGRSSEVYHIESIGTEGKWQSATSETDGKDEMVLRQLALTSFEGLTVFPQVRKNQGMEAEDVLAESNKGDASSEQGLWSSMKKKLFGNENDANTAGGAIQPKAKQADINIFSVASGQLYERFMSIMIASVMEHTNSTVKFWFIENFLSPSFKDFVPHMAREYNFDYEMITYKWPSWLRGQKEKQRTIWGYKILFLDVLFPLDLDKVIFVDADQIVRTDLQELVDLDLHGAPYGYTPFCTDRTEMDGFRFWNQGYWKDHLRGRPYHISALYVIDLVQFRKMAAGDRLRAQYQQLSADPNSLANLDQDLPNNMIHAVPIYSLPQDWLWCETWCSDESLKSAKTIDLCNNPLTKEPKLDRARRQVPEWEAYDEQVDALRKRIAVLEPSTSDTDVKKEQEPSVEGKRHVKDEL